MLRRAAPHQGQCTCCEQAWSTEDTCMALVSSPQHLMHATVCSTESGCGATCAGGMFRGYHGMFTLLLHEVQIQEFTGTFEGVWTCLLCMNTLRPSERRQRNRPITCGRGTAAGHPRPHPLCTQPGRPRPTRSPPGSWQAGGARWRQPRLLMPAAAAPRRLHHHC